MLRQVLDKWALIWHPCKGTELLLICREKDTGHETKVFVYLPSDKHLNFTSGVYVVFQIDRIYIVFYKICLIYVLIFFHLFLDEFGFLLCWQEFWELVLR